VFEATPAGATWRDGLVFRDYRTTELRTSLIRCVDHRREAIRPRATRDNGVNAPRRPA
jgi:hypothetical protein